MKIEELKVGDKLQCLINVDTRIFGSEDWKRQFTKGKIYTITKIMNLVGVIDDEGYETFISDTERFELLSKVRKEKLKKLSK